MVLNVGMDVDVVGATSDYTQLSSGKDHGLVIGPDCAYLLGVQSSFSAV